MTEDRDKWRKYVHGVANPRIEDGEGTGTVRRDNPSSWLPVAMITVRVKV